MLNNQPQLLTQLPVHGTRRQTLPVCSSVLKADSLLVEIARLYPLGVPSTCQLLLTGSNDTYLITSRDSRFVLRVYGSFWRSVSDIEYELDLLLFLAARGVPVATPIPAKDGALRHTLLAPEGPRALVLFTYAEGRPMSWENEDHCRIAGQLAARIHAASDEFISHHRRISLDLQYLICSPLQAIRPFLNHRPDDWEFVKAIASRLYHRADAAARAGLDWGVCHGDMSDRNIHITPDGAVTIFDFDLCGPGWRACDFVAVRRLATFHKRPGIWNAFADGYLQTRSLTDRDLHSVPLFQAVNRLWSFGTTASLASRRGAIHLQDHNIDYYLTSLREQEESVGEQ